MFIISCLSSAKCDINECLFRQQILNCVAFVTLRERVLFLWKKKQSALPLQDARCLFYNSIILRKGLPKVLFNYIMFHKNNVKLSRISNILRFICKCNLLFTLQISHFLNCFQYTVDINLTYVLLNLINLILKDSLLSLLFDCFSEPHTI